MSFYVREFSAIITVIYIDWFFYWSMYRLLQICSPCWFFFTRGKPEGAVIICANRTGATLLRVRAHSWWRACAHSWPSAWSSYQDGGKGGGGVAATDRLSHQQPRGKYFTCKPFVCAVSPRFGASLMRLIGSESLQNPGLIASIYYATL